MTSDSLSDLVEEMRTAAREAARTASGRVIRKRIAVAHPDLPPLSWGADDGWTCDDHHGGRSLIWHATARVEARDDAETREIVTAYARALDGTDPREVDMGKSISHLVTTGTFHGMQVTVFGALRQRSPESS